MFVGGFPGIWNGGSTAVGDRYDMDAAGVMVVEDENLVVATRRGVGEFSGLIRVGFEKRIVSQEGSDNIVSAWSQWRS